MEKKPIFIATHSRSCSTAFERAFLTRHDILNCFHEPFGDAFYFGPERISTMWKTWPVDKIEKSGRAHCTYGNILQNIFDAIEQPHKRVFIKEMARHIIPPPHFPTSTVPSLQHHSNPNDPPNPTLLPTSLLQTFDFVFLIRSPAASLPSLYRLFLPRNAQTAIDVFDPDALGYRELRILFNYLRNSEAPPILIDADDLLPHPHSILRTVCTHLGMPYSPSMLSWGAPDDQAYAEDLFGKFAGYHDDALRSTGLHPRQRDAAKAKTREEEDEEWRCKFGSESAGMIREAVDRWMGDYEFLRGFRILPDPL